MDPEVLLNAVVAEECVGRRDGDLWMVNLSDVITWYDTCYEPPNGEPRVRYVLVNIKGDTDGTTHYDMPFRCRFVVPGISAVINNLSSQTVSEAVDRGMTFVRGRTLQVADDIKPVTIELELSLGTLISLAHLADISGHNSDDYMALMGHDIAHV